MRPHRLQTSGNSPNKLYTPWPLLKAAAMVNFPEMGDSSCYTSTHLLLVDAAVVNAVLVASQLSSPHGRLPLDMMPNLRSIHWRSALSGSGSQTRLHQPRHRTEDPVRRSQPQRKSSSPISNCWVEEKCDIKNECLRHKTGSPVISQHLVRCCKPRDNRSHGASMTTVALRISPSTTRHRTEDLVRRSHPRRQRSSPSRGRCPTAGWKSLVHERTTKPLKFRPSLSPGAGLVHTTAMALQGIRSLPWHTYVHAGLSASEPKLSCSMGKDAALT